MKNHHQLILLAIILFVSIVQWHQIRGLRQLASTASISMQETELALSEMAKAAALGDTSSAQDYMIFSVRSQPGEPDVFAAILNEAGRSLDRLEDAESVLALDLFMWVQETLATAERMIPFMPVDTIENARQRWNEFALRAEASDPSESEFDEEALLLTEFEQEHAHRIQQLLQEAPRWERRLVDGDINELDKNERDLERFLNRAFGHLELSADYAEAGVHPAEQHQELLESAIRAVQRARTWSYNRHALDLIENVHSASKGDNHSLAQLERLILIEEDRLVPYIYERYYAMWNKHFEELSTDDKVKAVKMSVLRTLGD